MAHIPGVTSPHWYENQWVGEALSLIAPTIATAVTAWVYFSDPHKPKLMAGLLVLSIGALLAAGTVKTARARSLDKDQHRKQSPDDLLGCVYVMYNVLKVAYQIPDTKDGPLRITIHTVVPPTKSGDDPEQLEQVLPYVGGTGGEAGRRFPLRSGIIGLAVRDKEICAASRQSGDYNDFIRELVKDWGYTEPDARRLTPDRQSWMAVPITGEKSEVLGVVFLDSNVRDFFSQDKQDTIIAACSGIAAYIDERY